MITPFLTYNDKKWIENILGTLDTETFFKDSEIQALTGFSKDNLVTLCRAALLSDEYTDASLRALVGILGNVEGYPHGKDQLLDGQSYPTKDCLSEIITKVRSSMDSRGIDL